MSDERFPGCRVHPTALIEADVVLGEATAIWDNVHIRRGARIGHHCILGEKTYLAYDVRIGNYCKLNASVYVCAGVTIDDYAMISAHTVFTNDLYPRAFDVVTTGLATSEPTEETLETHVGRGVTIGANATIGPGIVLAKFSMVGMGSVVTKDVPPHALVLGNPARIIGWVCACGPRLASAAEFESRPKGSLFNCGRCGRRYERGEEYPVETRGPTSVSSPEESAPK